MLKSSALKSLLKLLFVGMLLAWTQHVHAANGCRDVYDYTICMSGNYFSCQQTMQRCTLNCQPFSNPNCPTNPNSCFGQPNQACMQACTNQINACQAACWQQYCQ